MSSLDDLNEEQLKHVQKMILKLRKEIEERREVDSISSSAGSVSYDIQKMEERLKKYLLEEKQLVCGVNTAYVLRTADMQRIMG